MRLIGHLDTAAQARALGDFLLVQGIPNETEPERDGTYALWIVDEDHLAPARAHLERFRKNPEAPEFQGQEPPANEIRRAEKTAAAQVRQRTHNRRALFAGSGSYGVGPLTFGLIALCVAVAYLSNAGRDREAIQPLFITSFEVSNNFVTWHPGLLEIRQGQIWRLLTPMFIHFGAMHILGNMLWLFSLGSMIEGRLGTGKLALLVVVIAACSNFGQYVVSGNPMFGGMSGVVYGLFGYVWIRGQLDPASGLFIDHQNVVLMIVWFFLCFTGLLGPIANTAHTVGLLLGLAWGYGATLWKQRNR
jgi:GlpG protein